MSRCSQLRTACQECYTVVILACMVSNSILQCIGFVRPYWSCGRNRYYYDSKGFLQPVVNHTECITEGLFYKCDKPGNCEPKFIDPIVFSLCFVSLIINLITVPLSIHLYVKQYRIKTRIYMKITGCNCGLTCKKCSPCSKHDVCCLKCAQNGPYMTKSCVKRHSKAFLLYVFSFGQGICWYPLVWIFAYRIDYNWSDCWSSTIFLYPTLLTGLPLFLVLLVLTIIALVVCIGLTVAFIVICVGAAITAILTCCAICLPCFDDE